MLTVGEPRPSPAATNFSGPAVETYCAIVVVPAGSKNRPLATAFEPGRVLMTLILTCPRTVQIRYPPAWKEDTASVSNTVPLAASVNCTASALGP